MFNSVHKNVKTDVNQVMAVCEICLQSLFSLSFYSIWSPFVTIWFDTFAQFCAVFKALQLHIKMCSCFLNSPKDKLGLSCLLNMTLQLPDHTLLHVTSVRIKGLFSLHSVENWKAIYRNKVWCVSLEQVYTERWHHNIFTLIQNI